MPNMGFRLMSFAFRLRDRLINPPKVLEKLGIKEGQTILDFGCGPGSFTIPAAKLVGERGKIYALDIHPLAIKAVRKKAQKYGLTNIETIFSDRDTWLPEESVDVVLLYGIFHMIKDKQGVLKELHRLMKANGLLSIMVGPMKPAEVQQIVEQDGLFSLRDGSGGEKEKIFRPGKILNFSKEGGLDEPRC